LLQQLLDDPELRSPAIQGLAALPDEHTPRLLLERYDKLTVDERTDAILTLAARPEYALDLLDAVEQKIVPRQDVSAFMVRQLLALNNKRVTERVNQVWGTLRSPSADKAARLTNLKKQLEPATLKQANLAQGRALYTKHCASCHKLFGEGGAIGPDLTGSQRTNLDYLLENMLDPSAVVPREYQVHVVLTASGRTISGILKEETDKALVMQTQNETIVVPKDEIDSRRQSGVSMMPEGVIEQLRPDELRDLVAYLAGASR
jgi:putative heme-binding domain-containing protein